MLFRSKFVKFTTFLKPEEASSQRFKVWQPWPYTEGLTIKEAMNDLTLLVTGLYGKPISKQNGAPIRLVIPWKYGYKSVKSIVKIEFTATQPKTFWNTIAPNEYDFYANVNSKIPHPRWSQENEKLIGTWQSRPTLLFNGYGEWVAYLYK